MKPRKQINQYNLLLVNNLMFPKKMMLFKYYFLYHGIQWQYLQDRIILITVFNSRLKILLILCLFIVSYYLMASTVKRKFLTLLSLSRMMCKKLQRELKKKTQYNHMLQLECNRRSITNHIINSSSIRDNNSSKFIILEIQTK